MTTSVSTQTASRAELASQKHGCLFYIVRGLKWFAIGSVVLIILGVSYQTISTEQDKARYAPRGQFYTVNSHQMHIVCLGEGSPAVILQAGATAESLWWYWVQNQVAESTRVCAYDRAGLGWSEPTSGPRDPVTVIEELHSLLQEAGVSAPYIMAGHSFGAVWARIFAAHYPQEVSGVVLVDSTVIPGESDYPGWKTFNDVVQIGLWAMMRTGVVRLTVSGQFQASGYPPGIAQELSARQALNQTFDTTYAETITTMPAFIEAVVPAENLGSLPMAVLWAGAGPMGGEHFAEVRTTMAGYSSNSTTLIIEGADHGSILGNEQYARQVSDAILDVIEAAQTGERLAQ